MDIKETTDVFVMLKGCAIAMKAAKADGKVDWKDLLSTESRALIPLVMAAAAGSNAISAEIKDADPAEVKKLIDLAIETGVALVDALLT